MQAVLARPMGCLPSSSALEMRSGLLVGLEGAGPAGRKVTRRLKIRACPSSLKNAIFPEYEAYAAIIVFIFMTPYSASVYSGAELSVRERLHALSDCHGGHCCGLGNYISCWADILPLLAGFIKNIIMLVGVAAMLFFVSESKQVGGFASGVTKVWESMCAQSDAPFTRRRRFR